MNFFRIIRTSSQLIPPINAQPPFLAEYYVIIGSTPPQTRLLKINLSCTMIGNIMFRYFFHQKLYLDVFFSHSLKFLFNHVWFSHDTCIVTENNN